MWLLVTIASLVSLATSPLAAQCPPGEIRLASQAEVDAFASTYPTCTDLPGSLTVIGNGVTDLSALSGLQSVGGSISFFAVGATSLALPLLTEVGMHVAVSFSSQFSSIGLASLEQVGGTIYFQENELLTSLQLSSLRTVGEQAGFLQNAQLETLVLPALESVGEGLGIIGNDHLSDVNLDSLEVSGGGLYLWGNEALRDFEAPRLESAAAIFFWGPSALERARFPALREMDTLFFVLSCQELVELDFPVLESVGQVRIENNAALTRLDLPADPVLTSSVSVIGNPLLSECCGFLGALSTADPNQVVIEDNAPGCNSADDIESTCLAPPLGIPLGGGAYRWLFVAVLAACGILFARGRS